MDRFTMYPVAFITTVQPWIAAWVLAISFFLTMLVVALIAKGRSPKQVAVMTGVGYVLMVVVVGAGTAFFSGLNMVTVEVVHVEPKVIFQDYEDED